MMKIYNVCKGVVLLAMVALTAGQVQATDALVDGSLGVSNNLSVGGSISATGTIESGTAVLSPAFVDPSMNSGVTIDTPGSNIQVYVLGAEKARVTSTGVVISNDLTVVGTLITSNFSGNGASLTGINPEQVGAVPAGRTITINNQTQDLSSNIAFNVGGVSPEDLRSAAYSNGTDFATAAQGARADAAITNNYADNVVLASNLTVGGSITCGSLTLQGATPQVSATGLRFYTDFETNTVPVPDLSGMGGQGIISGAVWTASGKSHGGAYIFNGTNQWIQFPNSAALTQTNQLTLLAWVKYNGTLASGSKMIMTKGPSGTGSSSASGNYELNITAPGYVVFNSQYNTTTSESVTGTKEVDDNGWHLVGATVNATGKVVCIYVDGLLNYQKTTANVPIRQASTNVFMIGRRKDGNYFNGTIDEVRLYDRVLSQAEMYALWQSEVETRNLATFTAEQFVQTSALASNNFKGTMKVEGAVIGQSFAGNGNGLTNLNGANLVNASVSGSKLANGTVTSTQIAGSTITASQIANNTITSSKIVQNTLLTGVNADMVDGMHATNFALVNQGLKADLISGALAISNELVTVSETFDTDWTGAPWSAYQSNALNAATGWTINNAMITNAATTLSAPYVCMLKETSGSNAWVRSPVLPNGYSTITFGLQAVSNVAHRVALEVSYDNCATWQMLQVFTNAASTNMPWNSYTNTAAMSARMYASQCLRLRKVSESTSLGYRLRLDSIVVTRLVPHATAQELQIANLGAQAITLNGQAVTNWNQMSDAGALHQASNLADIQDAAAARANLGLGSAALSDTNAFATAAEGQRAATALQVESDTLANVIGRGSDAAGASISNVGDLSGTGRMTFGNGLSISNISTSAFGAGQQGYCMNGSMSISDGSSGSIQRGTLEGGSMTIGAGSAGSVQHGYNNNGSMTVGDGCDGVGQYGVNSAGSSMTVSSGTHGAAQFGLNCWSGQMTIGASSHGAIQHGVSFSGGALTIGNDSYGASQQGGADAGAIMTIGSASAGSSQNGYSMTGGGMTIGSGSGGNGQFGVNISGTMNINDGTHGAIQFGFNNGGAMQLGSQSHGACQHGFCVAGGIMVIGDNAPGAEQLGGCFGGSATNNATGALQLLDLGEGQQALTTAGGAASLMLGAGVSSNRNALVVGDGAASHGDGSVTAAGGFHGDGSGIRILNPCSDIGMGEFTSTP